MIAGGPFSRVCMWSTQGSRRSGGPYRRTYPGYMRDELVNRALKEKSLTGNTQALVNNIKDLQEVWDTLDACYDWPEKHITEALEPIVKFRRYRAFENGAIREFYSLLRSAILGAQREGYCNASSMTRR
jgi:hypothetical protein